MIACVAYMAGYDLDCNQTQTFVYAYLAGVAINEFLAIEPLIFSRK